MLSLTAFCQGGVNFEHITFDEALAKAKAENKLVFMDCIPHGAVLASTCQKPSSAGKSRRIFNPKFVCVKFDMEKEKVLNWVKIWSQSLPTFLILRPDGSVQHKVVGGGDLEGFIARVEKGLNERPLSII